MTAIFWLLFSVSIVSSFRGAGASAPVNPVALSPLYRYDERDTLR